MAVSRGTPEQFFVEQTTPYVYIGQPQTVNGTTGTVVNSNSIGTDVVVLIVVTVTFVSFLGLLAFLAFTKR